MKVLNIKALEIKNKHCCLNKLDFKQEIEIQSKLVKKFNKNFLES